MKKQLSISDYTILSRVQVARLVTYLQQMIHHVEELGCTCATRDGDKAQGYHRPHCTGNNLTADARRFLTRLRRKGLSDADLRSPGDPDRIRPGGQGRS